MNRIAVLTSGGDSPGMNACVRAIYKACYSYNIKLFGIYDGFEGMINNKIVELDNKMIENIIHLGGTVLGTARSERFRSKEFRQIAIANLKDNNIDGLIVIGGDGTFTGASILSNEMNIPIIGIPGTIDNDIYGTDFSIGFDSAVNTAVEAVDKIRDTASSHHRVFFVEVMGRNSGHIALACAISSGVEIVLLPESKTNIEELIPKIKHQLLLFKSAIIIVAEGDDAGGSLEIMNKLKPYLPSCDMRASILGHIQRGGAPSAFDRLLASKMGVHAVELLKNNKSKLMVTFSKGIVSDIDIDKGIYNKSNPLESENVKLFNKLLLYN